MKGEAMDSDLAEEIEYMTELLAESGFFSVGEMMEILEEQFMEEEVDFSGFDISLNDSSNENFSKLEDAFVKLSKKGIVAIHNCGYDIEEGVADTFELQVHLLNNKLSPRGFCFYTFEDVEYSVFDGYLKITFGDFENDENKALEIGRVVCRCLEDEGFTIDWDETVNNQIEINPFKWDKSYDDEKEYEIEGAYDVFVKSKVLE
jgi:hypothetical protein